MSDASGFIIPPPIETAAVERVAVVWAGDPEQTSCELWVDNTRPGDSSVNVGSSNGSSTIVMPLTPQRARELAHELIIRADLINPLGATS
jgi:hypothetical protein